MSEQGLQGWTNRTSKTQCKRGEDVFLTAILQTAKTVAGRLNNLSKTDKEDVAELLNSGLAA